MRNILFFLMCIAPLPALAVMQKPAELVPYIHAQTAYGDGVYTWTMFTAYEASLWTDAQEWQMDSPFALSIQYRMHFTPQELADRSVEEMAQIETLSDEQQKAYGATLAALLPDVKKNDVLTALRQPGKGAAFFHNGKPAGSIADETLARRFFGIWLSPKTSAPKLRSALLSLK